jgi:hypothetical protein
MMDDDNSIPDASDDTQWTKEITFAIVAEDWDKAEYPLLFEERIYRI